jgi:ankyrin repeat protein
VPPEEGEVKSGFRMVVLAGLLVSPVTAIAQNELFRTDKLIDSIVSNDYELAKSILIKGHDPDPVDSYRRTPLILAAMAGNADLVELLVEYKAKMNIGDEAGGSALHYASARGHVGVVDLLLELGARINIDNRQGMTPLMMAASDGRIEIVQILLNRKADATRNDYTGRTALMWAQRNGRKNIIRLLRRAGIRE